LGRRRAILLYGTLAIYLIFCWAYRYGNWFQVILPAYPLVLVGVAAAMNRWRGARSEGRRAGRREQGARSNTQHALRNMQHAVYWLPLVLLISAIAWRFATSLPAANSRSRPTDTALERAAGLLAQPLPDQANLFAELNDGLALQYLIDIWQIRPDLKIVSSPVAAEVLAQGKPVFATWQAAPILRTELPLSLTPSLQSAGPDWIIFAIGKPVNIAKPDTILEQALTPDVSLYGYSVKPTPTATPAQTAPVTGMDVTLFWRIQGGDWPDGLSISVRPTLNGALIPRPDDVAGGIIQQDNPRPAHGMLALAGLPPATPIADAYRFLLSAPLPAGANGLQLLLYRTTATGFENVAELSLPIQ
jgi:hypothetical protein